MATQLINILSFLNVNIIWNDDKMIGCLSYEFRKIIESTHDTNKETNSNGTIGQNSLHSRYLISIAKKKEEQGWEDEDHQWSSHSGKERQDHHGFVKEKEGNQGAHHDNAASKDQIGNIHGTRLRLTSLWFPKQGNGSFNSTTTRIQQ